jgi:hypothetical protein
MLMIQRNISSEVESQRSVPSTNNLEKLEICLVNITHYINVNCTNVMKFFLSLLKVSSFFVMIVGFLLWQIYMMMYRDVKDNPDNLSEEGFRQKKLVSILVNTIHEQENLYADNGMFSTKISDTLLQPYINEQRLNEDSTKIHSTENEFVVVVSRESQNVIGILNISKPNLNSKKIEDNNRKSQYLRTSYLICTPNKSVDKVSENLDISNLKRKCPVGYSKFGETKTKETTDYKIKTVG